MNHFEAWICNAEGHQRLLYKGDSKGMAIKAILNASDLIVLFHLTISVWMIEVVEGDSFNAQLRPEYRKDYINGCLSIEQCCSVG